MKKKEKPIKNTIIELSDLSNYYCDPKSIIVKHKNCYTGVRNFSIDEYGKVKLCFGMPAVGDLRKQDPKQVWYGDKAKKLRKVISKCQRNCRILPCNRRENLGQLIKVFLREFY
jgi:hypothetical protein